MSREIPAVDVEVFHQAFDKWQDRLESAPRGNGSDVILEAVFVGRELTGFDDTQRELVSAIGARLVEFYILMCKNKARVLEIGGFPYEWIEQAATAPLQELGEFDASDFEWPESQETAA